MPSRLPGARNSAADDGPATVAIALDSAHCVVPYRVGAWPMRRAPDAATPTATDTDFPCVRELAVTALEARVAQRRESSEFEGLAVEPKVDLETVRTAAVQRRSPLLTAINDTRVARASLD